MSAESPSSDSANASCVEPARDDQPSAQASLPNLEPAEGSSASPLRRAA
ncbi:hypothetical protein [Rarobacter faecitabidus]|nr:hypothetical protein [Rarobacter faecitabidus]